MCLYFAGGESKGAAGAGVSWRLQLEAAAEPAREAKERLHIS